ncbi:MAG: CbtB domain-containing protein [Alphaproteobacteria bacterium]
MIRSSSSPLLRWRLLDQTTVSAVTALFIGITLIFLVGFAGPQVIHDAAHDGRHSFSFPCH